MPFNSKILMFSDYTQKAADMYFKQKLLIINLPKKLQKLKPQKDLEEKKND